MKILFFLNNIADRGGTGRIVADKINYLAQYHDIEIFVAYFECEEVIPFYSINKFVNLIPIQMKPEYVLSVTKPWILAHLYGEINRIVKRIKPDVVDTTGISSVNVLLLLICRNVPIVTEKHFTYEGLHRKDVELCGKHYSKSLQRISRAILRRYINGHYNKCVVLTNDDVKAWGLKNTVVIPNFTNLKFPEIDEEKREKLVINVGRLAEQKDQKTLIEAWKVVNKHYPDWKLEIWGDGELKEQLQAQIEETGVQESVYLKGLTSHIETEYPRASIFALSSRYEGMPLVAIESMTAGVPCVSYDIMGIRDVITDCEDGVIVPERTPEALAQGIMRLIEDTELRKSMAEASLRNVKKFDKDKIMSQWISLFDSLVKEKKQKKLRKHHFLFK